MIDAFTEDFIKQHQNAAHWLKHQHIDDLRRELGVVCFQEPDTFGRYAIVYRYGKIIDACYVAWFKPQCFISEFLPVYRMLGGRDNG
jgi:hypothetical protein